MKLVVALGGNSLIHPKEKGTAEEQISRINETLFHMKPLTKKYDLVLVHGNGPQVGNLLLQEEKIKERVPEMPLDVLDAMTQGQIGYWLQQSIQNIWKKNSSTVITRVLVDEKDPAFNNPTKPIGPYYTNKIFPNMVKEPEGWRRVVASPKPVKIVDIDTIQTLAKNKFVVIACGGGGIPVIKKSGKYIGVEAVIDKDRATQKLASQLKSDLLIFVTDVDFVYYNYGKRDQKPIKRLDIKTAEKYLKEGQFGKGSMEPKIESSIEFLKSGGKRVIITSPEKIELALKEKSGTVIE